MSFQKQLQALQRTAGLTCADLSRVFRVTFPTMRCWLVDGKIPMRDVERPLTRIIKLAAKHGKELKALPERKRSAKLRSLLRAK